MVEREEERPFGVISQTLSNMLGCEKGEKPGITGSQGKICLVRKKKVVQDLGSLAWNLYLMDLIKKKKKEKSICRMKGNKNGH